MRRFLGHDVRPELLALLAGEFILGFAVAAQLWPGGLAVAGALVAVFSSYALGAYRPQLFRRVGRLVVITLTGWVAVLGLGWLVELLFGRYLPWRTPSAVTWAWVAFAWLLLLLALRLGLFQLVRTGRLERRVAVLGAREAVAPTLAALEFSGTGFFTVVDAPVPVADPAALRRAGIRNVLCDEAALDALPAATRERFALAGVALEDEEEFWFRHLKRISVAHLTPAWFEALDRNPLGPVQRLINRLGDIAISLGLLLFTLPLMALVAVLVRIESPGPVLYRQERVGLGGRSFVVLKFRSMKANAETRGPAWAQARDPRVTRIGSIMRRTRIDELPQLINVLRGQMSFIGPRPERPHFVEQLATVIPFYRERHRVKPGLTGWAQVNYPYGASVEDAEAKLSYDLYYVQNRSVWLDLATLFATVRVIVFQEGSR